MPFSSYHRRRLGQAEIAPAGDLEAGSYATLPLTYTAGVFGIDDTGRDQAQLAHRLRRRQAPVHRARRAPGYSTAAPATAPALAIEVNRNNIRPWVNTLLIRVARGFLRAGERIVVTLGDRSRGAPGHPPADRLRERVHFKTFVDAFATYDFVELPQSPKIRLVPGPVAPLAGDAADAAARRASRSGWRWSPRTAGATRPTAPGRPSRCGPIMPVEGLPEQVAVAPGDGSAS